MIEKPYFVILNGQKGTFHALIDENGGLAFFESEIQAINSAQNNVLGSHFGFEVFELGSGL